MNSIYKLFTIFFICFLFGACALKPVEVMRHKDCKKYKYAFINSTNTITSVSGYSNYNSYSYTYSKHLNPSEYIAGYLMKNDILIVDKIKKPEQTIIVNYGQSGKRDIAGGLLGYTIEITIQILDASSHELIAKCTAEGLGSTEVDDTREAIDRCMQSLQ